jgi:undecaprenyl-phosphate 4-deoxy-4-formamido-L-arabinose transferase
MRGRTSLPAEGIDLSVVIPVYGSAPILPALVARLEQALRPLAGAQGFEVLLVHDHGPDNAWDVIVALAAERPWLRGIDLGRNAGQHNAIMAGLGLARGSRIVTMDDDLQHDPDDIPRILACLDAGHDLCYAQFTSRQHALWKRLGSWFNDVVARQLLKKPKGLYLSPFRGFRRALLESVLRYDGPFVYLDGLLLQSTGSIGTIVVPHHPRSDGHSGYSLSKSISLWLQMATSFSVTPLRLVSLAGIAASIFGFLMALLVLVRKLMSPDMALGWPSLIITILLLGGMQLLALGVIGEYIGRVLLTFNRQPQYVVRRTLNDPPAQ